MQQHLETIPTSREKPEEEAGHAAWWRRELDRRGVETLGSSCLRSKTPRRLRSNCLGSGMQHLDWSQGGELRNLLFTIYCPGSLVDVSEEFPAGHSVSDTTYCCSLPALLPGPGVTKTGGVGGVFGRVSLFVVRQLSGIEGSPRQWLHLNGEQSRQTEETERGGFSAGRQYNV